MEVSKKSRKKTDRALKRQQEKKEKKLLKQAAKAKPAPTTDAVAPKTGGVPAQDPAPQEETGGVSALAKAQDDSEDEIPLLVPLKETPAAGSAKVFSLILVPIVDGFWGPRVPAGTAEGQGVLHLGGSSCRNL